jgi:hypothetical protein
MFTKAGILFDLKKIETNRLRKVKYAAKITDFAFSRKLSRKFIFLGKVLIVEARKKYLFYKKITR